MHSNVHCLFVFDSNHFVLNFNVQPISNELDKENQNPIDCLIPNSSRKRKRHEYESESLSHSTSSNDTNSNSLKAQRSALEPIEYEIAHKLQSDPIQIQNRKRRRRSASLPINESDKWTEDEAMSLIMDILKEYPFGTTRYKLMNEIQRRNDGVKWTKSYGQTVGELNDFLKRSVMTAERMRMMLRYRHCLYESDSDTDCDCGCNVTRLQVKM